MNTLQEQIIQAVEDVAAAASDLDEALRMVALRLGQPLSEQQRQLILAELRRAMEASQRQRGLLHTLRQKVSKRFQG